MANKVLSLDPGPRLIPGESVRDLAAGQFNYQNDLVARAGGGQTNATQLMGGVNEILTCASGNDSVKLPRAVPGRTVILANNGAQTTAIFPLETAGVTIDGAASKTLATAKNMILFCISPTEWETILTA